MPKKCRGSLVAEGHQWQGPKGLASAPFWPEGPKSGTRSQVGEAHLILGLPKRRRFHCPAVAQKRPQILFQRWPAEGRKSSSNASQLAVFEAANPLPTQPPDQPTAKAFWPEGPKSGRGSLVAEGHQAAKPRPYLAASKAFWPFRAKRGRGSLVPKAPGQASGLEPEACASGLSCSNSKHKVLHKVQHLGPQEFSN